MRQAIRESKETAAASSEHKKSCFRDKFNKIILLPRRKLKSLYKPIKRLPHFLNWYENPIFPASTFVQINWLLSTFRCPDRRSFWWKGGLGVYISEKLKGGKFVSLLFIASLQCSLAFWEASESNTTFRTIFNRNVSKVTTPRRCTTTVSNISIRDTTKKGSSEKIYRWEEDE